MPINRLVVKKEISLYAETLFNAANESGGQDTVVEVRNQFEDVVHLMNADLELSEALNDFATYTPDERRNLIESVFADCNPMLLEVMSIMAERGDIDKLINVFTAYEDELNSQMNLCVVDVVTYVPLDDNLRRIIIEKTEADLGKKAVLRERIDKSILGGIIMSTGGKRIDASVISQLNSARQLLKETSDGGES